MAIRLLQQTETATATARRSSDSSQPTSGSTSSRLSTTDKTSSEATGRRKRSKADSPSKSTDSPSKRKRHCSASLVGERVPSLKPAACYTVEDKEDAVVLGKYSTCNLLSLGSPHDHVRIVMLHVHQFPYYIGRAMLSYFVVTFPFLHSTCTCILIHNTSLMHCV